MPPAESIGAYLAWNGERALAWCDAQPGQQEWYVQLFDAHGQSLSKVQRLTDTVAQLSIPSIRAWQQGFVVSWNEYQRSGMGAHAEVVSSAAMLRRLR